MSAALTAVHDDPAADPAPRAADPGDVRRRARARLARGRQKALAAETLWAHEQCAEAIALRRGALDEAVAAAALLAGEGAPWTRPLAAAGLAPAEVAAIEEAHRAHANDTLPALDEEVGAAEDARHAALARAHAALDRALAGAVSPAEFTGPARALPAAAVAVILLAAGAVVARHVAREDRTAVASAHLTAPPGFPPAKALDGDATTEWLLPLGQTGWIDVRFRRPRALRAVRLLNAHNRTFNDLATHDYRVEAFAGERAVGSARGSFAGVDPSGPWARHPIAAEGVTRVRVWVDSFHGAAGGFGEIEFE